jgi:hypothetical protein
MHTVDLANANVFSLYLRPMTYDLRVLRLSLCLTVLQLPVCASRLQIRVDRFVIRMGIDLREWKYGQRFYCRLFEEG